MATYSKFFISFITLFFSTSGLGKDVLLTSIDHLSFNKARQKLTRKRCVVIINYTQNLFILNFTTIIARAHAQRAGQIACYAKHAREVTCHTMHATAQQKLVAL